MLLAKPDLEKYIAEIHELEHKYLSEMPKSVTYFGIINSLELQAVASVKCYSGHWYLRSCVVKPEHRGRGLQRELIRERLEYLAERTNTVRVSVFPQNIHSIKNIEAGCFAFEKKKKLVSGKILFVYKKSI